ncbi:MAG: prepilin-type N-terminal cleavage/methylation domain-containing protein [Bdellovibrionales bacterium]|nr:prepilin-type N-terminal cleavage/methylation domain-containing protein [Bdellovibrionales bacterium]
MTKSLSNKGFSLIELMIVVAIIGILSAIAIPNFQRFQMKSRQSEAKNSMAAVYQAEKAFHQEWGQYFADWRDIGYAPEGSMKYWVATSNAAGAISPSMASGYMGPSDVGGLGGQMAVYFNSTLYCTGNANVAPFSTCVPDGDYQVAAAIAAAQANAAAVTNSTFSAAAGSDLDRGADANYDVWVIDETKNLWNQSNDAAN